MNFKRKHIAIFAVVCLIAIAGCAGEADQSPNEEQIENNSNVENTDGAEPGASYAYEIALTEKNQMNLVQSQPPQTMENSLERQNLINRYEYLNDQNNVHHVYALANDGTVIAYWVAQGKVSSVNSKLTNNQQIVTTQQCLDETWNEDEGSCFKTVESPQMDGSYGTNGNAIFFFTTSGNYVEWNGKYVVSEEPMNIQTPISLEQEVNSTDE